MFGINSLSRTIVVVMLLAPYATNAQTTNPYIDNGVEVGFGFRYIRRELVSHERTLNGATSRMRGDWWGSDPVFVSIALQKRLTVSLRGGLGPVIGEEWREYVMYTVGASAGAQILEWDRYAIQVGGGYEEVLWHDRSIAGKDVRSATVAASVVMRRSMALPTRSSVWAGAVYARDRLEYFGVFPLMSFTSDSNVGPLAGGEVLLAGHFRLYGQAMYVQHIQGELGAAYRF